MEWGAMKSIPRQKDELIQVPGSDLLPHVTKSLDKNGVQYVHPTAKNFFLTNGARFYEDVQDRWEYSTPEDTSFIGTTANEFASESILQDMASSYADFNDGERISLSKRVIDDDSVGCGYHASYCLDAERTEISPDSLTLYGVFAATRGVLFGSGALLPEGKFYVAQKAAVVNTDFSSGTTQDKPVVNLREEPHSDEFRFLRMHDTSGDPSISPWANRVKLGAASLVLRLAEHGMTIPELKFSKELKSVSRSVAKDPILRMRYKLHSGKSVTALDVQRTIIGKVQKLSREVILSQEEEWTLDEWDRAVSDLAQDPNLTMKRVEWVARRKILERYREKHGLSWDSELLRYKDIQFSEVALNGIAKSLRETLWAEYMPDETLISDRIKNPPTSTRAYVRSHLIRLGKSRTQPVKADWEVVKMGDKYHYLYDPYECRYQNHKRLH